MSRTTTPPRSRPLDADDGAAARIKGLRSFSGRYRILHLTWIAFFLSFVVWFNFAPFASTIGDQLGLDAGQLGTLALCNVALTVPARIFIGMALDRFGPRRVYAGILFAVIPCTLFATATTFTMLVVSRLLLGVVGAGFVVGIRMVSEWFPPREVGMAEGVYGGWGNFGSAAAAFSLPVLASQWALAAMTVPLTAVLGLIAWRVWRVEVLPTSGLVVASIGLVGLLAFQLRKVFVVNQPALADDYPTDDRYPFRSVAILSIAYACTFGSELAVVSMLPLFFADTWGLSPAVAGAAASGFAFMNLVARPAGGLLSDVLGNRRRTLQTLLVGLTFGYLAMALLGSAWPWPVAMVVTMVCSFFVQAGEGATFAIVPLVKRRVSGQIAGMAGAYGNVGAVAFLAVYLFVSPTVFFLVIAAAAVVGAVASLWLPEPDGAFHAELAADDPGDEVLDPEPTRSQPVAVGAA